MNTGTDQRRRRVSASARFTMSSATASRNAMNPAMKNQSMEKYKSEQKDERPCARADSAAARIEHERTGQREQHQSGEHTCPGGRPENLHRARGTDPAAHTAGP